MKSATRLTVYAYLCMKDEFSLKIGANTTSRFFELAKRLGKRSTELQIYVAEHEHDKLTYFTIGSDGRRAHEEVAKYAPSIKAGFAGFLTYGEDRRSTDRIAESIPRLLLFSAHGIAGYGFDALLAAAGAGVLKQSADQALAALGRTRSELIRVGEADSEATDINQNGDRQPPLIDRKKLKEILSDFNSKTGSAYDELVADDRSDREIAPLIITMHQMAEQPNFGKTGFLYMAAGPQVTDTFSVRDFRLAIEQANQKTPLVFDTCVLQSCSLGMVEIGYELRKACRTSVFSPHAFGKSLSLDRAIWRTLLSSEQISGATLAAAVVQAERSSFSTISLVAVRGAANNLLEKKWNSIFDQPQKIDSGETAKSICSAINKLNSTVGKQCRRGAARSCGCGSLDIQAIHSESGLSVPVLARTTWSVTGDRLFDVDDLYVSVYISRWYAERCRAVGLTIYAGTKDIDDYHAPEDTGVGFEFLGRVPWDKLLKQCGAPVDHSPSPGTQSQNCVSWGGRFLNLLRRVFPGKTETEQ